MQARLFRILPTFSSTFDQFTFKWAVDFLFSPHLLGVLGTSVRSCDRRRAVFGKVSTQFSVCTVQVTARIILWNRLSPLHLSIDRPNHLILFNGVGSRTLLLNSTPVRNIRPLRLKNLVFVIYI